VDRGPARSRDAADDPVIIDPRLSARAIPLIDHQHMVIAFYVELAMIGENSLR